MKLVSTAAAVLLLVLAASAPAHAQLTGSLNGLHDITVTNLKATADKVPADLYDFRPTDEVRTLGQILAHVANSQYAFCSAASGQDNPMSENWKRPPPPRPRSPPLSPTRSPTATPCTPP